MIETVTIDIRIAQIFITFVCRLFFVLGLVALAVGIGLIVNQAKTRQLCHAMNQWVSLRPATKWLTVPHDTLAAEHRFRHSLGTLSIILAGFSIYVLSAQIDVDRVASAIPLNVPHDYEVLIVESLRRILIAGSLLALVVGFMLVFFPQTLRAVELRANRWYSTRGILRGSEIMHTEFDKWVDGHPRACGWIITSGALVIVVDFGILLMKQG